MRLTVRQPLGKEGVVVDWQCVVFIDCVGVYIGGRNATSGEGRVVIHSWSVQLGLG